MNMVGDGAVQNRHFGWQSVLVMMCEKVRCPGETAHHDATFLVSSLSVPLGIFPSVTTFLMIS